MPATAPNPWEAITEPTRPPIRAWDELDGSPRYQVTRFHVIAPARPAKTTVVVTSWVSTKPLPTVAATFREMKAPTKFSSDASAIAGRGGSAREEIALATTFAVSWNPFVKSNARAVKTTMTRMMSALTRVRSS